MRIGSIVVLFCLAGAAFSARADVIVSGYVYTQISSEPGAVDDPCSASGSAPFSLSLACSSRDPLTTATVTGSGDAFSGSLYVDAWQGAGDDGPAYPSATAIAQGQLNLDQTYVVLGGVGATTVSFEIDSPTIGYDEAPFTCLFTFDGTSQSCEMDLDAGSVTYSETVEYGVPFSIGFDTTMNGFAQKGDNDEETSTINYGFNEPESIAVVTSEPSSLYLLLSGLAGAVFVVRSRLHVG